MINVLYVIYMLITEWLIESSYVNYGECSRKWGRKASVTSLHTSLCTCKLSVRCSSCTEFGHQFAIGLEDEDAAGLVVHGDDVAVFVHCYSLWSHQSPRSNFILSRNKWDMVYLRSWWWPNTDLDRLGLQDTLNSLNFRHSQLTRLTIRVVFILVIALWHQTDSFGIFAAPTITLNFPSEEKMLTHRLS